MAKNGRENVVNLGSRFGQMSVFVGKTEELGERKHKARFSSEGKGQDDDNDDDDLDNLG